MKKQTIIVLAVITFAVCGRGQTTFPELVPKGGLPNGYAWKFHDGPDFYVYYAAGTNQSAGGGIYFGMQPNVSSDEKPKGTERGALGKLTVQWQIFDGSTNFAKRFYRQCLVPYRYSQKHWEITLHAWVFANTSNEVCNLEESLQGLRLELTTR